MKDNGGFFHKISDIDIRQKPFDSCFAYKGLSGGIEFKFTKHGSCYPYRMLRGSSIKKPGGQVKGLRECHINGGDALVIVYSSHHHRYAVYSIKEIDLDTKCLFECSEDIPQKIST